MPKEVEEALRDSLASSKLGLKLMDGMIEAMMAIARKNGNLGVSGTPESNSTTQGELDIAIRLAGTLLHEYAESVKQAYPELKDSCRDLFREVLYSAYN